MEELKKKIKIEKWRGRKKTDWTAGMEVIQNSNKFFAMQSKIMLVVRTKWRQLTEMKEA